MILKVHTSNYRIQGFTPRSATAELCGDRQGGERCRSCTISGSGTLVDLARTGWQQEPTVREAVAEGADVVTFSGDKLLGGPQAGFIVGRRDLIAAINRNPMKRALRVDKIRLAAIEATLKLYRDPDRLAERLPTLRLLTRPRQEIEAQAARALPHVAQRLRRRICGRACECRSQIGSGALPLETIESAGLAIRLPGRAAARSRSLARRLRALPPPVIGRIEKDRLVLDLRCLSDEEAFLSNLPHLMRNGAAAQLSPDGDAVIVGLAGHIDHGKTALVRALTGVDGDRLKEEKARGITIDLGFAYMPTVAGAADRLHRCSRPRALRSYDARGRKRDRFRASDGRRR